MTALPPGWRWVRLGEVADTALGKMLDAARPKGAHRVPYLRNVNVQWGHINADDVFDVELSSEECERFRLANGDLLVCEGGEIGRAAIWRGGADYMAYQKALHRVRSKGDLNLTYLRYLLEHYTCTGELRKHATGSTILHLPQRQLRELAVPLPTLSEQGHIVETLEAHLSRLDAASRQIAAAVQRVASWRRGSLDAAVLAQSADRAALGSLLDGIEAGRSFGGPARPAGPDEWGIIKVSAMTWGEFRPHENKAVASDRVDPRFEIRPGDILVSRANTTEYVGAPVLVGDTRPRLLLSDKSLRLLPKPSIDPRWLATVLSTREVRRQISRLATGTKDSMRNISQGSLLSIVVPTARPDQQARLAESRAEIDQAATATAAQLATVSTRSAALRRALLAAAFSGRLTNRSQDTAEIVEEFAHV